MAASAAEIALCQCWLPAAYAGSAARSTVPLSRAPRQVDHHSVRQLNRPAGRHRRDEVTLAVGHSLRHGTRMLNIPVVTVTDWVVPVRGARVPENVPCTRLPSNAVNITVGPPYGACHSFTVGCRENFVSM